MASKILLMAILFLLVMPSALALNCTKYKGDYKTLCGIINPLPFTESYKKSLIQPNLYGQFNAHNGTPNLQLQKISEPSITLEQIYNDKILIIGKFVLFIIFLYIFYYLLTKFKSNKYG